MLARPAFAQFGLEQITSAGPLTRIIVSNDLSCQVAHRADDQFEFFPSESEQGDCGTYLALGGAIFGPSGGSATSNPWEPVSQAPVTGAGTAGDPLRIVTTVEIAAAALRVQQTDSYVVGTQSYRTDVQISNVGTRYKPATCTARVTVTCRATTPGSCASTVARRRASSIRPWACASSNGRRSRRAATSTPVSSARSGR